MSKKIEFSIEPEFQLIDHYFTGLIDGIAEEYKQIEHTNFPFLRCGDVDAAIQKAIRKSNKHIQDMLKAYGRHIKRGDIKKLIKYLDIKQRQLLETIQTIDMVPYDIGDATDPEATIKSEITLVKQRAINLFCRFHNEFFWEQVWKTLPIVVSVVSLSISIFSVFYTVYKSQQNSNIQSKEFSESQ